MANILQGLLKEMHKFGIHISSITISMFQSILRRENSLRIDLEGNAKHTSMKSTNKCCPTCSQFLIGSNCKRIFGYAIELVSVYSRIPNTEYLTRPLDFLWVLLNEFIKIFVNNIYSHSPPIKALNTHTPTILIVTHPGTFQGTTFDFFCISFTYPRVQPYIALELYSFYR